MTAVWRMDLSPTDKLVLLALADAANDEGVTWMAIKSKRDAKQDFMKKTSLSRRTVQTAMTRLEQAGLLHRQHREGRGTIYTVMAGGVQEMRPAGDAPGGAADAPKPSNKRQLEKNTPRRRCPPEWEPSYEDRLAVPDLSEAEVSAALAEFRDHTFGTARSDWSATFRNWLREAKRRKDRDTARQRTSGPSAKLDAKRANHERAWRAAISITDDEPGWGAVGEDNLGGTGVEGAGFDGASLAETGGVAPGGQGGGDARDFPPLRLVSPTGTG